MSFNSTTFGSALAKNPTGVQALVGKIYSTLDGIATGAIGTSASTTTGAAATIAAQTTSLQDSITSINSQVAQITKENNAQLNILVQEYSAAESESTSAQITQSYLDVFTSTGNSSG